MLYDMGNYPYMHSKERFLSGSLLPASCLFLSFDAPSLAACSKVEQHNEQICIID